MKSDYILPEPGEYRRPFKRYIGLAAIFTALWFSLGDDSKTADSEAQASPNAKLSSNSLADLSPISNLHAMAPAPEAPTPLVDVLEATDNIPLIANPELDLNKPHTGDADNSKDRESAESLSQSPQLIQRELTVKDGDALSLLFDRNKLKTADWLALSRLKGDAKRLQRLRPGDVLKVQLSPKQQLQKLSLRLDETRTLLVTRDTAGKFQQSLALDELESKQLTAKAEIDNSLFLAGKEAGLSDRLIMELAEIFAWDVDFALDIRGGDQFSLVYEELYRDGKKLKEGNILAAEFHNRGREIRAVRYTDVDGRSAYYTPEGKPMKKAFLRNPVDFTRISSRFSKSRKHPVLNTIRAHKGVDYAASRGTPVKSAGAGKVIFAGKKGGYGNTLIVQHGGIYQTLYAHLKGFRKGIRRGSSVNQGQTIGYVGSSGMATGPHLHYEFRTHGKHVDPLKVRLPAAKSIAKSKRPAFEQQTRKLVAKLDQIQEINVAQLQ